MKILATPRQLNTALTVRQQYADLDPDLADAVTVALAGEYLTDTVLTPDRRDFRAMRPLTGQAAFRLLPDDAERPPSIVGRRRECYRAERGAARKR